MILILNRARHRFVKVKKYALFLFLFSVLVSNNVFSSDADDVKLLKTMNTNMFTIGTTSLLDTYLSPLEYKGFNLRLVNEQMRETYWFDGNFRKQQNINLEFAKGNNPHGNASFYWLKLQYQLGGHILLASYDKLKINVGALADVNAGGLYSNRNGNNPATARAYINLTPSVLLSYLINKNVATRLQFDMSLLGLYFQPEYGESYYELYLGNRKNILNFTSLHNQRTAKLLFTTDFTYKTRSFRIGILSEWHQSRIHHIQTHHYSTSVVLGIPIQGYKKTKREQAHNTYWED